MVWRKTKTLPHTSITFFFYFHLLTTSEDGPLSILPQPEAWDKLSTLLSQKFYRTSAGNTDRGSVSAHRTFRDCMYSYSDRSVKHKLSYNVQQEQWSTEIQSTFCLTSWILQKRDNMHPGLYRATINTYHFIFDALTIWFYDLAI